MRQASNTNSGVFVTFAAPPNTRTYRRRVSALIRELDKQAVERRPNPGSPLAYLDGDTVVVPVHPGVISVGAVKQLVLRTFPRASFLMVPMSASGLMVS